MRANDDLTGWRNAETGTGAWVSSHVDAGDHWLAVAESLVTKNVVGELVPEGAMVAAAGLAAIAQAHYAAAMVRA